MRAAFIQLSAGFSAAVFLLLVLHVIQKAALEPAFQFGVSSGASGWKPEDVWNMDETGSFGRGLPETSLNEKG